MTTQSVDDFLAVPEAQHGHTRHRSRSGGYQDFLEDQVAWERGDRERQMRRYYSHKPQASDRLAPYVPAFDTGGHRRVRSQEMMKQSKEEDPVRTYNVREIKPQYDLSSDTPLPSQLPVRIKPKQASHKPKISVQIHQGQEPSKASATPERKPGFSSGTPIITSVSPSRRGNRYSTTTERSPRSGRSSRNASASPRSPSSTGLQLQYSTLQNKFAQISTICAPNADIEAARPQDLTFSKISDEVRGYAFQLQIWGQVVNIDNTTKFDKTKRDTVDMVSRTLDKLLERVTQLSDVCSDAKPRDLRIEKMPEYDNDADEYDDYESFDDDSDFDNQAESLGYVIQSHLRSIGIQIQTLSRLTRALQDATPEGGPEVDAIDALVRDVDRYFGDDAALHHYQIDERFKGRKALEEARATDRSGRCQVR
ncbi:hypothetical protein EJ04DRAFT_509667 [Polyplosphaeria fusca]|uniref:Uncharacterized protein n=1 Tax=Polyplosphaeria fusca TaxID=682080 RepID=A0A9P4V387_9PLEO|nr:hypothetical protein EJ04DRAFT_509667 [Polyplosphaeria fusca]